ncbi:NYN domain-containing protein [Nocardia sp. NBC_01377]|uniref:NYN domain-containing protein n=1 Tax=Nocardia sp. NBC_01377 TaxID=2903595 RepID=UPI0032555DDD
MSVGQIAHETATGGVDVEVEVAGPAAEVVGAAGPDVRRVLLVWDAPNLDMGLGAILGGRPTAAYRPRFDALGRWLLARTAELSVGGAGRVEPEATVFTNIAPGTADVVRPWVEALRNVGYAVFAKPKIDEDSDVDADMLGHIELRRRGAGLAGIVVASADGQAFREPLEELAAQGIPVQVLGFREHASWAVTSDTLEFIDLEDIPGVFREPLPRVSLDSLPDEGAWLQPFRPLTALLTSRPAQGVA